MLGTTHIKMETTAVWNFQAWGVGIMVGSRDVPGKKKRPVTRWWWWWWW
jgi:hypothetical protein